jgi:glutathione-regulated potassium-efflux system ancillary protein KefG
VKKVLILFALPSYQKSVLNKSLNQQYDELSQVTFHDLYEVYPNFIIDVKKEQELLIAHDIIVFQHPLYWYSSPALMKEWLDSVFQHGYAYGAKGLALKGKVFLSVVTTGADSIAYLNDNSVRNVMQPFERTVKFCNSGYLPPYVIHGGLKIKSNSSPSKEAQETLKTQVKQYRSLLDILINNPINHQQLQSFNTLNEWYLQSGVGHD